MNYSKIKGVIVKKDDNEVFIRYYDYLGNSSGLRTKVTEDLKIGDFVETQYWEKENGLEYGFHVKKIQPTDEDIRKNDNLNQYLKEVSKNLKKYYNDLLKKSREVILKTTEPSEIIKFNDIKDDQDIGNKRIILSDDNIKDIITILTDSIIIIGIGGSSGSSSFYLETQLRHYCGSTDVTKFLALKRNRDAMGIVPELEDGIFAGKGMYLNDSYSKFLIYKNAREYLYETEVTKDGVRTLIPYNSKSITEEIVYLDKENYIII